MNFSAGGINSNKSKVYRRPTGPKMVEARPPYIEGGLVCQDGLRVPFSVEPITVYAARNIVDRKGL